jgi:hypothetical protein
MIVHVCDKCKKHKVKEKCFYTGERFTDAAGSRSDEFYTYDLCDECELNFYRKFVTNNNHQKEFCEYLKGEFKR